MKEGKELLIKLKLMISDKEMQKRLYKLKTYDGKIKEVECINYPLIEKANIRR